MAERGRPSKGRRSAGYTVRFPAELGNVLDLARKQGCSSVSQWLADLACIEAGKPQLVRELNQGLLEEAS
ncbi:hypothetical protein DFR70_12627 [Nocardia tenerifensis]|uniref:Uncharacterized protein n=1 Tax=Nocardia tenerifensis TaxID=228006 RepID=A0A318JR76_9NOCA|nr:hypothetical protein DFR70_12627 [Nocardia tenerifensis]